MCIAPNTLPDGTQVACHECWQCREQAINDWVGRNIAESKTSTACHAVTLTYGRGRANEILHERAVILTYSDVQKYLKLLRRHGFPVRYFVTGEFGSLKGRAHWHIMLYWQERVPEHVLDENFMEQHWPHGWSFWTRPTAHAVRYNCKYIQKDMGEAERQGHLAMSKKPPLGAAYFQQVAEQYVRQGLAPQTLEYTFPEVRRRRADGRQEVVPFMLKDRSAELFLEHYVRKWREAYPGQHLPNSALVEEFLDPGAWKERAETNKPFVPPEQPRHQRKPPMDWIDWRNDFDRRMGDGEERQQQAEREWREREDQRYYRYFKEHHDTGVTVWDEDEFLG
ncbi:hypothetical protein GHV40_11910 [Devosia sp. D6-9]|nr:hypothetical protein GHV40_11910 [Devosia sp. D6-9]